MPVEVNTANWFKKSAKVKYVMNKTALEQLAITAKEIHAEAAKNLKGPHYGVRTTKGGLQVPKTGSQTGKMPIPRVTATLARSLYIIWKGAFEWIVGSSSSVAKYNWWVHDGTRYMKARRFIGDVVAERKQALLNRMRYAMLKEIRKEGRA